MGQKVHPYGMRLGIIRPWLSRWFAEDARYRDQLIEDVKIRRLIKERLRNASVSQVAIERNAEAVTVIIATAKPGVVIGRSGSGVDRLNKEIHKMIGRRVHLTVEEVKRPELDAQLVADNIAHQIERRISFRRAVRQSIQRTMRAGGGGMKVKVGGRLGGSEIAHSEMQKSPTGRVPLHTFRADVDYGLGEARTNQGNIGVKVWIYKGDIIPDRRRQDFDRAREQADQPGVQRRRDGSAPSEPTAAPTPAAEAVAAPPVAAAPVAAAPEAAAPEAAAPEAATPVAAAPEAAAPEAAAPEAAAPEAAAPEAAAPEAAAPEVATPQETPAPTTEPAPADDAAQDAGQGE